MNQTEFHSQKTTYFEVSTFEKIKRLLAFENGQPLAILDIGSGSGILNSELATMGHLVTGLDILHPKRAEGWEFAQSDINLAWPVADSQFDVVICTDVAEHMYSPNHILEESQRVLKPNGKLIFGVPNHFDLRQRFRLLFGKGIVHWDSLRFDESAWDYAHIRFFTVTELRNHFLKSGWQIEAEQFNFMGAGIVPGRLLPRFVKTFLVKTWPGLFSGKFIFLLSKNTGSAASARESAIGLSDKPVKNIYLPHTPPGM